MRKIIFLAVLGLCFSTLLGRLKAQSVGSVVEGVVSDASGAVLPDCDAVLTNINTGTRLVTRTGDAGLYVFASVLPGEYALTISRDGFKTYSLSDFRVTVSERATQNAVLQLGATTDSVVVESAGSGALLEPTSNELGTLIESSNVQQLFLNGRDFL